MATGELRGAKTESGDNIERVDGHVAQHRRQRRCTLYVRSREADHSLTPVSEENTVDISDALKALIDKSINPGIRSEIDNNTPILPTLLKVALIEGTLALGLLSMSGGFSSPGVWMAGVFFIILSMLLLPSSLFILIYSSYGRPAISRIAIYPVFLFLVGLTTRWVEASYIAFTRLTWMDALTAVGIYSFTGACMVFGIVVLVIKALSFLESVSYDLPSLMLSFRSLIPSQRQLAYEIKNTLKEATTNGINGHEVGIADVEEFCEEVGQDINQMTTLRMTLLIGTGAAIAAGGSVIFAPQFAKILSTDSSILGNYTVSTDTEESLLILFVFGTLIYLIGSAWLRLHKLTAIWKACKRVIRDHEREHIQG